MAHPMFRREIGLLLALARDVLAGQVSRAGVVADHFALVDAVQQHHHGEDEHPWPPNLP